MTRHNRFSTVYVMLTAQLHHALINSSPPDLGDCIKPLVLASFRKRGGYRFMASAVTRAYIYEGSGGNAHSVEQGRSPWSGGSGTSSPEAECL